MPFRIKVYVTFYVKFFNCFYKLKPNILLNKKKFIFVIDAVQEAPTYIFNLKDGIDQIIKTFNLKILTNFINKKILTITN